MEERWKASDARATAAFALTSEHDIGAAQASASHPRRTSLRTMGTASPYPARALEHSHERLNAFIREVGGLLRAEGSWQSVKARKALKTLSIELNQELLEHFANEEEGLFPFIREQVPAQSDTVARLEVAHDAICGALLRFAHLIPREHASMKDALAAYRRFQNAFAAHSLEEDELVEWLEHVLSPVQRRILAGYLRGLA
jgi:hypothetical protein